MLWHSKRFPQLIAPRYKDFDLVENLVREAHDQGIEVPRVADRLLRESEWGGVPLAPGVGATECRW
ncbi:MAG: hypothetical protein WDO73_12225 [Ignavibacteriota bacterium]